MKQERKRTIPERFLADRLSLFLRIANEQRHEIPRLGFRAVRLLRVTRQSKEFSGSAARPPIATSSHLLIAAFADQPIHEVVADLEMLGHLLLNACSHTEIASEMH